MKLAKFMKENRLTDAAFANLVGSTEFAVGKWRRGERTPRRSSMQRILLATAGAVTPNDFLSAQPPPRATLATAEAQP